MASRHKRYALAIDTPKCLNCKACIVACRAENGVSLGQSRNWVNQETRGELPRLVAVFEPEQCHHCADPACVRVCPTGASWQRPDGVVVVNESDCIGCRSCMIACPYDARFFREDEGVVETSSAPRFAPAASFPSRLCEHACQFLSVLCH